MVSKLHSFGRPSEEALTRAPHPSRSTGSRLLLSSLLLSLLVGLAPPAAAARRKVAVLRFGGVHGETARAKIVRGLQGSFDILGASAVPDACADLGIPMSKGRNLARCAQAVNAVAVVGGTTNASKLTLVIFSGKTGSTLTTGRVRWSSFPSAGMVRGALKVVRRGLNQAPAWVGKRPRRVAAPTPAAPDPPDEPKASSGTGDSGGGLSFEPDDVNSGRPSAPTAVPRPPSSEEPPSLGTPKTAAKTPDTTAKKAPTASVDPDPRFYGTVGLGAWIRGFSINQPALPQWDKGYSSGAAFALRLEVGARPLAFFLDNFAAGIYARLRFQTTLGLKSGFADQTTATAEKLSTSMSEFLIDFGYHWNILDKADGPRVDFGLGYGMLDFSIDWGSISAQQQIPSTAYRFVLLGVGAAYPFAKLFSDKIELSGLLRFDYRFVLDAGGVVADAEPGFGPSSGGGLCLTLGLSARWGAILFGVEYTYTRFFYAFSDIQNRVDQSLPAAGGALDEMHAFIVSGGYSF